MNLTVKRLLKIFPCLNEQNFLFVEHSSWASSDEILFTYKGLSYYLYVNYELSTLLPYYPPIEDDSEESVKQMVNNLTIRSKIECNVTWIMDRRVYVPPRVKAFFIDECLRVDSTNSVFEFEADEPIELLASERHGGIFKCNQPIDSFVYQYYYKDNIVLDLTQLNLKTFYDYSNKRPAGQVQLSPNTKVEYLDSNLDEYRNFEDAYKGKYYKDDDLYKEAELKKSKKAKIKQVKQAGDLSLTKVICTLLNAQDIQADFNKSLNRFTVTDLNNRTKTIAVKKSKLRDLYMKLSSEEFLDLDKVVECCNAVFGETSLPSKSEVLDLIQNTLIDRNFEAYVFDVNKPGVSCTLIIIEGEDATLLTLKRIAKREDFEIVQDLISTVKTVDELYEGLKGVNLLFSTTFIPDVINVYKLEDLNMLTNKVLNFKSERVSQDGVVNGYNGPNAESCNKAGPRIKIKDIELDDDTVLSAAALSRFEITKDIEDLSESLLESLYNSMLVINGLKTWTSKYRDVRWQMGRTQGDA